MAENSGCPVAESHTAEFEVAPIAGVALKP
jgi:hypothetical protein